VSTVTDEAMRGVVAKAVFEALGQEQRDALITKALDGLMEPVKDRYGYDKRSLLEGAFRDACEMAARTYVMEKARDPEDPFGAKLREFVTMVVDKMFTDKDIAAVLADKIAAAVSERLWAER
jgi:hypothetical protein